MFPLPKKIWTEVITLYKNMPFLWDKKDPKYSSKYSREIGYNIILKKYKEYDKNATLPVIKRKIDNMRTSYRRELKKVLASKKHRSETEDIYVPELWYFDLLSFLNDQIILYNYKNSMDEYDDEDENKQSSEAQSYSEDSLNLEESSVQPCLLDDNKADIRRAKTRRKSEHRKKGESSHSVKSVKEDDWSLVGKSIGIQLSSLDNEQVVIAQKLISDAIYYAKLGRLTENSFITLDESNDYDSKCQSKKDKVDNTLLSGQETSRESVLLNVKIL